MAHVYTQTLIYRILKIIGGVFFVFCGIGSLIMGIEKGELIDLFSFLSLTVGLFLLLHALFFKIEITTEYIKKSVLFSCYKIPFENIEKIESTSIGPNQIVRYFFVLKNGKKKSIGSLSMILDEQDLILDVHTVLTEHKLPLRNSSEKRKEELSLFVMCVIYLLVLGVLLFVCGILTMLTARLILSLVSSPSKNIVKIVTAVVFVVYLVGVVKIFGYIIKKF